MRQPEELRAWGVDTGYWDVSGQWRQVPEHTLAAVLDALGGGRGEGPPTRAPLVTAFIGGPWPDLPGGTLVLEQGGDVELLPGEAPPPDLPFGYHHFEPADARATPTVAQTVAWCPARCPPPSPGRHWGWSVQLYASRSRKSWGMGDFSDLGRLVDWAVSQGAAFVLTNPLHAPAPGPVPTASPYSPSSRCFLNPLYINIEDVRGAAELPVVAKLAGKARALNADRLIDRTSVWAYKSEALEALFSLAEDAGHTRDLDAYIEQQGKVLDRYTTFCALAEQYGPSWRDWPARFERPDGPAVANFALSPEGFSRRRYHAWLQWLCASQLESASRGPRHMSDLAVAVDGRGADAWLWQDSFAPGMHVGAPPDEFNTAGQDWALAPWDPWKLRASGYEPYIQTLRAALRHSCGLRVDHVMAMFRLFWVPEGSSPAAGTYVRYPWRDLLSLLCLEAWRAGAYVVGEDLGTVEDHAREALHDSGVLSYKVFWFEPRPPAEWPGPALGALTTHDLPTVAGVWSGSDLADQHAAGVRVNEDGSRAFRRRIAEWTGLDDAASVPAAVEATYDALAQAPCTLLSAALDDALAVRERPNMPGTIDEWPNWCLALPVPLEEMEHAPLAAAIARDLSGR